MKISLVHKHAPTRQVLARALKVKLSAQVTDYVCVEDLLASAMDHDVFVVYNDLGHKMSGPKGVSRIRKARPHAFIVGVSEMPSAKSSFTQAGVNAFLLRAGNEIEELVQLIQSRKG